MHMGYTAETTSFSYTDLNLLEFQSKLTHRGNPPQAHHSCFWWKLYSDVI